MQKCVYAPGHWSSCRTLRVAHKCKLRNNLKILFRMKRVLWYVSSYKEKEKENQQQCQVCIVVIIKLNCFKVTKDPNVDYYSEAINVFQWRMNSSFCIHSHTEIIFPANWRRPMGSVFYLHTNTHSHAHVMRVTGKFFNVYHNFCMRKICRYSVLLHFPPVWIHCVSNNRVTGNILKGFQSRTTRILFA